MLGVFRADQKKKPFRHTNPSLGCYGRGVGGQVRNGTGNSLALSVDDYTSGATGPRGTDLQFQFGFVCRICGIIVCCLQW